MYIALPDACLLSRAYFFSGPFSTFRNMCIMFVGEICGGAIKEYVRYGDLIPQQLQITKQ